MKYHRDYKRNVYQIWSMLFLVIIAPILHGTAKPTSQMETIISIIGVVLFFSVITLFGNGMFTTFSIDKKGITIGKKFISWADITEVKKVDGFPSNLHLKYRTNSKTKTVLLPWPIKNFSEFKTELKEVAPMDNPLSVLHLL